MCEGEEDDVSVGDLLCDGEREQDSEQGGDGASVAGIVASLRNVCNLLITHAKSHHHCY